MDFERGDELSAGRAVVGGEEGSAELGDGVRLVGTDPSIVAATAKAARERVKTQRPKLEKKLRAEKGALKKLEAEKKNIVAAVSSGQGGGNALLQRLGEVETEVQAVAGQIDGVRAELAALDLEAVDERDLKRALASFVPVWDALFPEERARIMQLLVERVTYDGEAGDVEIQFRPGGVKMLAEDERATA